MRPKRFGQYVLLERLAAGGMGEIYVAVPAAPGGIPQLCVIKKLLPALHGNAEFQERFEHEAQLAVAMSHPNIVTVHQAGRLGRDAFIAMELIEGRDLGRLLARCQQRGLRLPLATVLYILREVLLAVDYCHRQTDSLGVGLELLHRDISPGNVMVSYDGAIKLADFGLARSGLQTVRTSPEIVLGKPGYVAPERLRGKRGDQRSDLFCVGVLLYELLTGTRLTQACEPRQMLEDIERVRLPRAADLYADAPPQLDRLLQRALALDPERRYPSARAFCVRVQQLLAHVDPACGPWDVAKVMDRLFDRAIARRSYDRLRDAGRRFSTSRSLLVPTGERPISQSWPTGCEATATSVTVMRESSRSGRSGFGSRSGSIELQDSDLVEVRDG